MSDSDETTGVWEEPADRTIRRLEAENEKMRAIVDKLPKTADGVPVVPGMEVWCQAGVLPLDGPMLAYPKGGDELSLSPPNLTIGFYVSPNVCYSTREAAEAAEESADSS